MDAAGLTKLLSREGWALLGQLPPYQEDRALHLASGLRDRGIDPDLVAAAMTQSRLRSRAHAKFGEFAAGMLFTEPGLEQATRLVVGAHHARRFAAAGAQRVADLGCGIGGDAMALSALGLPVLAAEQDEMTAAIATVNLRHFPEATVRHADAMTIDLAAEGVDAAFIDPARRTRGGRRVFDPNAYQPTLPAALALRESVDLGLKVAPGIPHAQLPSEAHAQWVSVDGDVVEAGLWFGRLSPEGPGRSALVLRDGTPHVLSEDHGGADAPVRAGVVRELDNYLYEPDGAVIRAGLVARAGEEVDAGLAAPAIAYLTGPRLQHSPFLRAYRVLDTFPFGLKRLRTYLRERQVGSVTIKKRGTAVEPGQLRNQLALHGANRATIILTRIGGRQSVVVVDPA